MEGIGMNTRLLVYGSLRRGERANRFLADATFVGVARTAPGCMLYDLGAFPGLVHGGEGAVLGELYDVDDDLLARLDRYEGTPNFYRRELVELEDGSSAQTYTLRLEQVRGCPVVGGGDWCKRRKR
jgi:gamma-glutamylaminecyclotransferase